MLSQTVVLLRVGTAAGGAAATAARSRDRDARSAVVAPRAPAARPPAARPALELMALAQQPPNPPYFNRLREEPRGHYATPPARPQSSSRPTNAPMFAPEPPTYHPAFAPILPVSADLFGVGVAATPFGLWRDASELVAQAAATAPLAHAMRDLAFNSLAGSSQDRYLRVYKSFVDFCVRSGIPGPYMPAAPAKVGLFLTHITGQGQYGSSFSVTAAALRWAHLLSGYPSPFEQDASLALVMAGARRTNAQPEHQTEHLTLADYHRALEACDAESDPRFRQLALMLAISFGAALRFSELIRLTWKDLHLRETHLLVMATRFKVRPDGTQDPCPLPASRDGHCPVTLAVEYASLFGISLPHNSSVTLWPVIPAMGDALDWDHRVSNDYCYQALRSLLTSIGLTGEEFSWHSSRSGAATAADEAGLGEHVIATLGGWKSRSVQRYMRVTEGSRLTAAASMMGLPPPTPAAQRAPRARAPRQESSGAVPLPSSRKRRAPAPPAAEPRPGRGPRAALSTTLLAPLASHRPAAPIESASQPSLAPAPRARLLPEPRFEPPRALIARAAPPFGPHQPGRVAPLRPQALMPLLVPWKPPPCLPGPQAPPPTSSAFPSSRFASSHHHL